MPNQSSLREPLRFYFSFRSPYSWLAFERLERAFKDEPIEIEYLPVFPPPGNYPNDPAAVPNKLKYMLLDVARLAEAYGLRMTAPSVLDTEWVRPHATFIYAQEQRRGHAFGLAMSRARFSEGHDVGDDAVIAQVASKVGLDPKAVVASAGDVACQTRVVEGMIQGATQDSIFGVPLFVYRGEPFWGNDRIEWVLRAIHRTHGQPVTDLRKDVLQPLL